MAATHQSWHIATSKDSSLKHHIYYTYSSHNTHMIHKSFSTTSNYHKTSLQIIIYIKTSLLYYPKLNSQSLVRNRSQQQRKRDILSQHCSLWRALMLAWREITGLSPWRVDFAPSEASRVSRYGELGYSPGERWRYVRRGELRFSPGGRCQNRVRDYELFHQKSQFSPC